MIGYIAQGKRMEGARAQDYIFLKCRLYACGVRWVARFIDHVPGSSTAR